MGDSTTKIIEALVPTPKYIRELADQTKSDFNAGLKDAEEVLPEAAGLVAHGAVAAGVHVGAHLGLNAVAPGIGSLGAAIIAPVAGEILGTFMSLLVNSSAELALKVTGYVLPKLIDSVAKTAELAVEAVRVPMLRR